MAAGELTRRWAVALVGVPLVLALLRLGGWFLGLPVAVLAAAGAAECYRLAEAKGVRPFREIGIAAAAGLVLAATRWPVFGDFAAPALAILAATAGIALVMGVLGRGAREAPLASIAVTLFGAVYAGLSLAFVPLIHVLPARGGWGRTEALAGWAGLLVVALPLVATWVGDAAAFFAGGAWGRNRRRLAPAISPAKSWVGAWAGVGGAAIGTVVWYFLAVPSLPGLPLPGPFAAAVAGATLGVAAIIGDLAESLLKREAGVKDSGRLLPGHGGVLDRLDALVLTLPLGYLILRLAEGLG